VGYGGRGELWPERGRFRRQARAARSPGSFFLIGERWVEFELPEAGDVVRGACDDEPEAFCFHWWEGRRPDGVVVCFDGGQDAAPSSSVVILKLEVSDGGEDAEAVVPAGDDPDGSKFDGFVPSVFDDMGQWAPSQPAGAVVPWYRVTVVEKHRLVEAVGFAGGVGGYLCEASEVLAGVPEPVWLGEGDQAWGVPLLGPVIVWDGGAVDLAETFSH